MQFYKDPDEQRSALETKYPEKDFRSSILSQETIAREYRKEFVGPVLLQLINKKACKVGRLDANRYEQGCVDIIEWTIGQELFGRPVYHPPSLRLDGYKRHIRDITFPIPQTSLSKQWESIKIEHNLKSIVFECKNYGLKHLLGNNEIYQLFEYINPDQHGKLGVILSRHGRKSLSPAANSAIDRIAKEKYRIIILGDDDFAGMIDEYIKTGSCSNFFYNQNEIARSDPK